MWRMGRSPFPAARSSIPDLVEVGATSTGATLVLENGESVSGVGAIEIVGAGAALRAIGDETLGSGVLTLGGASGTATACGTRI